MIKSQAYQTQSITESIVGFSQYLRVSGLNIGIQESQDALLAAKMGLLENKTAFKYGLKAIFCQSPDEGHLYERLFFSYWHTNPIDEMESRKNKTTTQGVVDKKTNPSIVILGYGKTEENVEEAKQVSGANETERLKKTDLSLLNQMDADKLEEIAQKLCQQMAIRLRRRRKEDRQQGQINLRRTIRRSLSYGGEPVNLFRKTKAPKKQRLIVFLDVSGSMDKYSFFLLRFICALRGSFKQLDAFVFSTSLIKITKMLQYKNLDFVLNVISEKANIWSGGTRIGESFGQFNDRYGKQLLNGSPLVLILSDGLDTGDTASLGKEMQMIQKRSKRIVWLNPLKGMKSYEPKTKGMLTALPMVDDFMSAHNLNSLLELENILMHA
jgi:uncharacterized protein